MPATLITIAAELAYGLWAIPLVLMSATLGASLAFLIARYAMPRKLRDYLDKRPRAKVSFIAIIPGTVLYVMVACGQHTVGEDIFGVNAYALPELTHRQFLALFKQWATAGATCRPA